VIGEIGGAHSTNDDRDNKTLSRKGLYFRQAYMKDRMTYIDENLLVSPSVGTTDERIRVFQRKLYIRAKQEAGFKAYSLYGKLCEDTTLREAYRRVKSNYSKGVGVDGQSFENIEKGERLFFTLYKRT
jgi:hypothetical protein